MPYAARQRKKAGVTTQPRRPEPVPIPEKPTAPRRRGRPPSADRPDGADEQRGEAGERALSVLDALAGGTPRLCWAEIFWCSGLSPSSVLRLSASLDRFGYLH